MTWLLLSVRFLAHQKLFLESFLCFRPSEEISLNGIDLARLRQKIILLLRFHTLDTDLHAHAVAKLHRVVHDAAIEVRPQDLLDEGPVDLHDVTREVLEHRQGRAARAEIVHGNLQTILAQRGKLTIDEIPVRDDRVLRKLQNDARRIYAIALNTFLDGLLYFLGTTSPN